MPHATRAASLPAMPAPPAPPMASFAAAYRVGFGAGHEAARRGPAAFPVVVRLTATDAAALATVAAELLGSPALGVEAGSALVSVLAQLCRQLGRAS